MTATPVSHPAAKFLAGATSAVPFVHKDSAVGVDDARNPPRRSAHLYLGPAYHGSVCPELRVPAEICQLLPRSGYTMLDGTGGIRPLPFWLCERRSTDDGVYVGVMAAQITASLFSCR